jgi:hypothetical protein
MKIETKQKGILVILLFLCYFVLLTPYVVHTTLSEVDGGIVDDLKTVSVLSLPADIQDVAAFNDECTVLLVADSISGVKKVIITEKSPHSLVVSKGDVVEVTDKIIGWYVDWHAYQFFDKKFNALIVGDVGQIGTIESGIEKILSSCIGSSVFSISKVIFALAPLLLILFISFSFRKRFYLWNIPAILALYSFEVFIISMVGGMHHIAIGGIWKYFGYLFVVLIPFTFFFLRYEESKEGQKRIKGYYEKITEIIALSFKR